MTEVRIERKPFFSGFVHKLAHILPVFIVLAAISGCGETMTTASTSTVEAVTVAKPAYVRQHPDLYLGVTEPRSMALNDMARDADQLSGDNINTAGVLPPVLINERAGGWPRVILDGEAQAAKSSIDDFHDKGLAVFLSTTTESPGLSSTIEPSHANFLHLNEDVLSWADTAEEKQVELFAPLCRYNQKLGAEAADTWSVSILPKIRMAYSGDIAAWVAPDPTTVWVAGKPHEFERLDFRGYDYLMVDIFPQGKVFNAVAFSTYVNDVLTRAQTIAARDGLKGVIFTFGSWREEAGADTVDGPLFGAAGQARIAEDVLKTINETVPGPEIRGIFFNGWTLPGRGAKGYIVEDTLRRMYEQIAAR
jgi:hypothetical protein